jgi:transcriptional regulator with XRE-family HTH domain
MAEERGYFAECLKALRDRAGLSQPELAKRACIGVSTLRQFEYGMREPTYGTLVKLAEALGVSLAAFDQTPGPETPAAAKQSRKRKGTGT